METDELRGTGGNMGKERVDGLTVGRRNTNKHMVTIRQDNYFIGVYLNDTQGCSSSALIANKTALHASAEDQTNGMLPSTATGGARTKLSPSSSRCIYCGLASDKRD